MIGARLKPAARRAVEMCGGVDGAAATTSRARSTTGRWMALNEADLPSVDCAVLLDQVAVADGRLPQITEAMARELGFALLRLPDVVHGEGDWIAAAGALSAEAGEAVQRLCSALADRQVHRAEVPVLRREVDDVIRAAVAITAMLDAVDRGELG